MMQVVGRPRCVVGVDPSLTGFALAAVYPDGRFFEYEMKTKARNTLRGRVDRLRSLADGAEKFIKEHVPNLCLIEGYAYAAKWKAANLGELGGVVRDRLVGLSDVTAEIPPTMLKKFAVGKGTASKLDMVQRVGKKFDREFKTDNMSDAFGLAWLAGTVLGYYETTNQAQRDVVRIIEKAIEQEME